MPGAVENFEKLYIILKNFGDGDRKTYWGVEKNKLTHPPVLVPLLWRAGGGVYPPAAPPLGRSSSAALRSLPRLAKLHNVLIA